MEILRNLTISEVKQMAGLLALKFKSSGEIIGLVGNLGSGKTTFAKAFLKQLGIKQGKSPTFVISHQYWHDKRLVCHMDFYRLDHNADLETLGLEEIMSGRNIVLIEWVNKFPKIEKACDVVINFRIKRLNKRDVTVKFN